MVCAVFAQLRPRLLSGTRNVLAGGNRSPPRARYSLRKFVLPRRCDHGPLNQRGRIRASPVPEAHIADGSCGVDFKTISSIRNRLCEAPVFHHFDERALRTSGIAGLLTQASSKGDRHSKRSRGTTQSNPRVISRDIATGLNMAKQRLALHIGTWKRRRVSSFTSIWTAFTQRSRCGTGLRCGANLSAWAAHASDAAF